MHCLARISLLNHTRRVAVRRERALSTPEAALGWALLPSSRLVRMPAGLRPRASTRPAAAAALSPQLQPGRLRSALSVLNDSTKFLVSAAAFAVLVYFHNAAAALALVGSIVAALLGKLLKRVLAQARPHGARKADPGMPSSHAVSLGYLATYAALSCEGAGAALGLQALGAGLTALRMVLGFHTLPQVVVGYALGAGSAWTLHCLARDVLLASLASHPSLLASLYASTALAVATFAALSYRSWAADAAHLRKSFA